MKQLDNSFFQWLIPFVVFINSWSFLGGWVTIFARTWLWLLVGVVALFVLVPHFFSSKVCFALYAYSIIVVFNQLSGDEYYSTWAYTLADVFSLLFYGGVCYYLLHGCPPIISKAILYLTVFVIIFTSISTYLADLKYPDIVRIMVTFTNEGISNAPYYRMGVCDYSMPHALPILIAPIVMLLKNKEILNSIKMVLGVVLFFIFLLVWTSGATTPLLIAIFALFVSFIVSQRKSLKANILLLSIITVIMIPLAFDDVQLRIIHYLEEVLPGENANFGKLEDFEASIVYGNDDAGDITARRDLYKQSIRGFSNHLFLGTNSVNEIGMHSIILDRFAMIGIIGMIPYLLVFFFLFRDIYHKTIVNRRVFVLIGFICFFAVLFFKNMLGTWMYASAFVMLPIIGNYKNNSFC